MCYGEMGNWMRKLEDVDPIGPELAQTMFKHDSQNAEALGKNLGWRQLERDAQWNQQNPEEGLSMAAVATGKAYLAYLLGGMGGGDTGYVDQIGNAAEGGWAGANTGAAAGGLMSSMGGNTTNAQKTMQMMQLMQAMQAQQQPQQGLMPPPRQQGQMPELEMSRGYAPTSANNSLGTGMPTFESEAERRKRLKMMRGY